MLACATIGTNDLPRAAAFYDEVLGLVGGKRVMEFERFIARGTSEASVGLDVTKPFDGNGATVGNGCTVAPQADSRATVDQVHVRGLEPGGSDEGAPGQRFDGFYAGYFRDPMATSSTSASRRPSRCGAVRGWRHRMPPDRISAAGSAGVGHATPAPRRRR